VETGEPVQTFSRTVSAPVRGQPVLDPKRAVDRALALRSDLRSAEQAVEAEHQAVRLAQRGEFPTVTIGAGYTTGTDTGIPIHGPSASVNVALPISHAAADRVNAERARLAQAEFKEASVRREIRTTVAAAARTYEESVRAAEAAARARDAAEKELAATQVGYRGGASSSLDVSDARRTYVQAALNELNALYAQAEAAATLEQETGP
jgi:outer membrane protein TolC